MQSDKTATLYPLLKIANRRRHHRLSIALRPPRFRSLSRDQLTTRNTKIVRDRGHQAEDPKYGWLAGWSALMRIRKTRRKVERTTCWYCCSCCSLICMYLFMCMRSTRNSCVTLSHKVCLHIIILVCVGWGGNTTPRTTATGRVGAERGTNTERHDDDQEQEHKQQQHQQRSSDRRRASPSYYTKYICMHLKELLVLRFIKRKRRAPAGRTLTPHTALPQHMIGWRMLPAKNFSDLCFFFTLYSISFCILLLLLPVGIGFGALSRSFTS